jgi:murein peptide amidase A
VVSHLSEGALNGFDARTQLGQKHVIKYMRAVIPAWRGAAPASLEVFRAKMKPAQRVLAPLLNLAENSDWLIAGSIGEFETGQNLFQIPRFIFMGPTGGGDTVRLGIFAAIRGDEPQGTEAIVAFLQELENYPELTTGYHIYAYPVCNPSGFAAGTRHNAAGQDLAAHFWRGSDQPEAYYLEREIGVHHFQGVISLGSADIQNPRFFFNGGVDSILRGALASPAMLANRLFLAEAQPARVPGSDEFPREPRSDMAGFLTRTDELRPMPFEINFEIPRKAPRRTQIVWTLNALKSILDSYRSVVAIRQNI